MMASVRKRPQLSGFTFVAVFMPLSVRLLFFSLLFLFNKFLACSAEKGAHPLVGPYEKRSYLSHLCVLVFFFSLIVGSARLF